MRYTTENTVSNQKYLPISQETEPINELPRTNKLGWIAGLILGGIVVTQLFTTTKKEAKKVEL
jgi:hypothetical protein